MIGTRPAGARRLRLAADDGDNGRADRLEPAGQKQPDPARRGVDEHGHPRLDPSAILDQNRGGRALQHQRGRILVRHVVGQADELVRRHRPMRGIGAARGEAADPIADREAGHALAQRLDHPRAFLSQHCGQLDRVEAGAVVGVDIVEPDRRRAQPHLARAGFGKRGADELEHVRPAGLCNALDMGLHGDDSDQ